MQKFIYLFNCETQHIDSLRSLFLGELARLLAELADIQTAYAALADADVEPAALLRQTATPPLPDAMLALWQHDDSTHPVVADCLQSLTSEPEIYHVNEREVIPIPPVKAGERLQGSMQMCTLKKLPELEQDEFLNFWYQRHSKVAVETQSTFGYRQNLVLEALNGVAQPHTAIVEEHFPAEAMSSLEHFFAAPGDPDKMQHNLKVMMESVQSFIALDSINVNHMSYYRIK